MRHLMTTTPLSRNAFADAAIPTFADLIARVKADPTIPKPRRQNWVWALKALPRSVGKDPAAIPAHPEFLRAIFKRAAPASVGLKRAAWNNVGSLIGKALEWAGLASMSGHYQAPFAPEWQQHWDQLPAGKTAMRMQLSRLLHFCSAQAIAPMDVNDEVLTAFHEALITESIVDLPYEIYRGSARSWNNALETIPGWPQQRLTVPSRQRLFTMPWSTYPSSLEDDVEAYCRRAKGLDLNDDHFLRAQRPATIETRRWQLRLLATAIVESGIVPDSLIDLRAMLAPETTARGLEYLLERNGGKSSVQISNLADFLPTLAGRLDIPEDVVNKLRRIKKKLKVVQHGMTARNREALRAFDDQAAVEALVNLPRRLLLEVQKSGRKGWHEAKLIQTALAIELLLAAAVRIQNLASIVIERHFIEVGDR